MLDTLEEDDFLDDEDIIWLERLQKFVQDLAAREIYYKEIMGASRQTAILRVNHQTCNEAYTVLYSELNMRVFPGDVICQGDEEEMWAARAKESNNKRTLRLAIQKAYPFLVEKDAFPEGKFFATQNVWRHHPRHPIYREGPYGQMLYSSPDLGGKLNPHVLARFQNITFEAEFKLKKFAPPMIILDDLRIDPASEPKFKHFFKACKLLERFVDLVSTSPIINYLRITLRLEANIRCPTYDGSLDPGDSCLGITYYKAVANARTRANELFLDSGILKPLGKLDNVKNFHFNIQTTRVEEAGEHNYEISPRYAQIIAEVREAVQYHWERRQDSSQVGASLEDSEETYTSESTI